MMMTSRCHIDLSRFAMCHCVTPIFGTWDVGPSSLAWIPKPWADAGSLLRYDYGSYFEVRMGNYSILNIATVMYLDSEESEEGLCEFSPTPGENNKRPIVEFHKPDGL